MQVSSHVQYTLSHASIIYKGLCFCVQGRARSARRWLHWTLCNTRSLLMKIRWNWRPGERMKRDKWRSNWRTVEIHNVGNARRFSLLEKGLLVFEVQNPDVEQYTKVEAAIQSAIQCYRVIYDEEKKKKSYYPDIIGFFFSRGCACVHTVISVMSELLQPYRL